MSSKWCVTIVALFVCSLAFAQDPTKTEPTHYKVAFENETVQVVDVHYGPHEKSGMHEHPGGVVVVITGGHLRFTDQKGNEQEVLAKAGESRWFPPFHHKVENMGDTPYNAVYVVIKGKHTQKNASATPGDRPQPGMDAETAKLLATALASAQR
jgi:quercetin dioxygenase-like cupin family protein